MERRFRPVLKWAGGKAQLLQPILAALPAHVGTYEESFVGGAAVFFALAEQGRFRRAILGDMNADLIAPYRVLQTDVERVIARLGEHQKRHSKTHFYRVRAEAPAQLD